MPTKKKAPAATKSTSSSPELSLINSLANILNTTGLSEIELEQKGVRVRVSRTMVAHVQAPAAMAAPVSGPMPVAAPVAAPAKVESASDHAGAVKSPMVGTAYLASAPGAANFVEIGSSVKQGQTLLIIEAMKTMNQIPAPRSGKVTHIMIESGQPVEFGEALMVIE